VRTGEQRLGLEHFELATELSQVRRGVFLYRLAFVRQLEERLQVAQMPLQLPGLVQPPLRLFPLPQQLLSVFGLVPESGGVEFLVEGF
jgi:hypothetical protein